MTHKGIKGVICGLYPRFDTTMYALYRCCQTIREFKYNPEMVGG